MGDGWETARHPSRPRVVERDPDTGLQMTELSDHSILKLGSPTRKIERIVIDTNFYRGNYPESAMVEGCNVGASGIHSATWFPLLTRTRLGASQEHTFTEEQLTPPEGEGFITHFKVTIFPDGGIQRMRVFGKPTADRKMSLVD